MTNPGGNIACVTTLFACLLCPPVLAQLHTPPLDPKQTYSPYPDETFANTVYFGDTHLHTSYSVDAGMAGNTVAPEDAYRFALGHEVTSSTGLRARLKRPLHFLVIADHAENLGMAPLIEKSAQVVLDNPQSKRYHDMVKSGKGYEAFLDWLSYQSRAEDPIKDASMVRAIRDPDGANLDRMQVIKGWVDGDGNTHERIFDIAASGDREIGADGRVTQAIASTVDVDEASYDNSTGAAVLDAFWKDPDFDPRQRAFYYVRVIEIPTPTFLAYDRKFYRIEDMPDDATLVSQERAITSPIWYTP